MAPSAFAQGRFPARPVTRVLTFPRGGGTDTGARLIAHRLSAQRGQQVLVDNQGGAAGQIGAELVAKSKPDGHTMLMRNIGTQSIHPSLHPKLPCNADKPLMPISLVADLPLTMMVNPGVAAKSAREFVALARCLHGELGCSSSGAGGTPHLAADRFKQASSMGGRKASAATREKTAPSCIACCAQGATLGLQDDTEWHTFFARFAATPTAAHAPGNIAGKVSADVREIVASDGFKSRLLALGGVPRAIAPAPFTQMIDSDCKRCAQIIRDRKITVDRPLPWRPI